MNVGPLEIIIVIVLVLLVFGARKLPELGSSLGQSIRGFGKGISGDSDDEPPPVEAPAEVVPPARTEPPAPAEAPVEVEQPRRSEQQAGADDAAPEPTPPERRPG